MDIDELGYAGTPINLTCDEGNPVVAVQRRVMQTRRSPTTPSGPSRKHPRAIENAGKEQRRGGVPVKRPHRERSKESPGPVQDAEASVREAHQEADQL